MNGNNVNGAGSDQVRLEQAGSDTQDRLAQAGENSVGQAVSVLESPTTLTREQRELLDGIRYREQGIDIRIVISKILKVVIEYRGPGSSVEFLSKSEDLTDEERAEYQKEFDLYEGVIKHLNKMNQNKITEDELIDYLTKSSNVADDILKFLQNHDGYLPWRTIRPYEEGTFKPEIIRLLRTCAKGMEHRTLGFEDKNKHNSFRDLVDYLGNSLITEKELTKYLSGLPESSLKAMIADFKDSITRFGGFNHFIKHLREQLEIEKDEVKREKIRVELSEFEIKRTKINQAIEFLTALDKGTSSL